MQGMILASDEEAEMANLICTGEGLVESINRETVTESMSRNRRVN